MSSTPKSSPDGDFHARLNRVADARAPFEQAKPYVSPIPDWRDTVRYPVTIIAAFLVGMLAVFVSRYIRFQVLGTGLAGDDPDIAMLIDAALAGALSFLVFGLLRAEGFAVKAVQTVGIMAMVFGMHNIVHAVPTAFSMTFSESWANEVVATTAPNSILFRGTSFVVYEPKKEVAAKPKVRRAGRG